MRQRIAVACLGLLGFAASAQAVSITFAGPVDLTGTGKGNVIGIISLSNSPNESGTTGWDGSVLTFTGDTVDTAHFFAQTAATLIANGIDSSFQLILQVNEAGPAHDLTLNSLGLNFIANDGHSLFSGVFAGPLTFSGVGQGTSGFAFDVNMSSTEITQFFGALDSQANCVDAAHSAGGTCNHLGGSASISGSSAGSDNAFALPSGVAIPTPEPGSLLLLGSGLAGLSLFRSRRSRRG